jgi:hypothetical protein
MGIYNGFIIPQGSTWTQTLTWKDSTGAAKSLAGYTAAMQLRKTYDGTAAFTLTSSPAAGLTIPSGGTTGEIQIAMTATQTHGLTPGFYVYDLEITSGGIVTRLIEGQLTVTPEVTQV